MTNKNNMYHEFFQNCCREFKDVIYISGNHEHYHGDIAKTHERLTSKLDYLSNLHILEKEYVTIKDLTFISSTLRSFAGYLRSTKIKAWTHGHTHDNYDYMIGTTRIVCNPRGYDGHEEIADHFELRYFDV